MTQYFYITTPIYYVNDKPHLGSAYTSVMVDIIARFKRIDGFKVYFCTGTDEHGQKIANTARDNKETPQELVDRVSQNFKQMGYYLNLTPDFFIRTSEDYHKEAVTALWNTLEEKGYIYKGVYSGWYSTRDEAFFDENELVDGKAPTGAPVDWIEEQSYFFKLSAFTDKLLEYYEEHPEFIGPQSRRNEVISFVKSGLRDLSVSRLGLDWGIQVPNGAGHTIYVWLDALTNYLSVLGYPSMEKVNKVFPTAVHVVGKDIIRFHAVYWPAFLMAAELPLPYKIYGHGWWTSNGQKMSKSLGNVIDPLELCNNYGSDSLRYFMMRAMPFGQDGDFSHSRFIQTINSELADGIGNLVHRILSFIYKHLDGIIPELNMTQTEDHDLMQSAQGLWGELSKFMENQELHKYLEAINGFVAQANRYIDLNKPWELKKTDTQRMKDVLGILAHAFPYLAKAIMPVTPIAAEKLFNLLDLKGYKNMEVGGNIINEPTPLFNKYEE